MTDNREARELPAKYRALSAVIDADIRREGVMSSTMVRAGLVRELLDDLAAAHSQARVAHEAVARIKDFPHAD